MVEPQRDVRGAKDGDGDRNFDNFRHKLWIVHSGSCAEALGPLSEAFAP
jgi:hypothetical protein